MSLAFVKNPETLTANRETYMEIITNHLDERFFADFLRQTSGKRATFRAAVAFFTSADFISEFAAASIDNRVHLIVSLNPPTSYHALKKVLWRSNVRVDFVASGLHSKIYILEADGSEPVAAIGSSNLTSGGLRRNIETNVLFRGKEIELSNLGFHFSHICGLADTLTPEVLEEYREEFEEFSKSMATKPKRAKSLLQPQLKLKGGAAKSFVEFWADVYYVHELVHEASSELFPNLPVYSAIDYFWHYVVSVSGEAEVKSMITEHGRDEAIRKLFRLYGKWENEGEQYWRVLAQKVEFVGSTLSPSAIEKLTVSQARDVYASLHSSEMAIQRFSRDEDFMKDNTIEAIIETFSVLLHSDRRIEFRIDAALTEHKLKHFGPSGVQELNGWYHPTRFPVRNSLAEKALSVLQIRNEPEANG